MTEPKSAEKETISATKREELGKDDSRSGTVKDVINSDVNKNKGDHDNVEVKDEDELCAICHDVLILKKAQRLPCGHKFCSICLNLWRSKFIADKTKKCPTCRSTIPATRQMISQLKYMRAQVTAIGDVIMNAPPFPLPQLDASVQYYGNLSNKEIVDILQNPSSEEQQEILGSKINFLYEICKHRVQDLEDQIGDCTEILGMEEGGEEGGNEDTDTTPAEDLPDSILHAVRNDKIEDIMNWCNDDNNLRINSKSATTAGRSLLLETVTIGNFSLMWFLLHKYHADVNILDDMGTTPLALACVFSNRSNTHHQCALFLLEWGADKDLAKVEAENASDYVKMSGNKVLYNILQSPLGGRRCEISGLQSRSDLNGQVCVVGKYLRRIDRYIVRVGEDHFGDDDEENKVEFVKVKSCNLTRHDRTVDDPGRIYTYTGRDQETNEALFSWKIVPKGFNMID